MQTAAYDAKRGELETYFDRTAVEAWARLTSDAPVGRIRATVRAGRNEMRDTLLSWLPADLTGRTVLDAGCGTGALALEAARRGAAVTAIDISPKLVALAKERAPECTGAGSLDFRVGDFLDPALGRFDHIVAMDSLIHYEAGDIVRALANFSARASTSLVVTVAPRTPALALMHAVGKFFPRADRAPAIAPVAEARLRALIGAEPALSQWPLTRTSLVTSGFYKSQALELRRR